MTLAYGSSTPSERWDWDLAATPVARAANKTTRTIVETRTVEVSGLPTPGAFALVATVVTAATRRDDGAAAEAVAEEGGGGAEEELSRRHPPQHGGASAVRSGAVRVRTHDGGGDAARFYRSWYTDSGDPVIDRLRHHHHMRRCVRRCM